MPTVLTLEKSLLVLEAVVRHSEGVGTRALAHELRLNVATVHNIAQTFVARGYLRQDTTTRLFHAGLRLMLLSRHSAYLRSLTATARPIVHAVADELNESVMLVTADHGRLINLEYVPGNQALRVQEPEDVSGVAHATAVGKLLLAYLEPSALDAYLTEQGLTRYTSKTLSDPEVFRAELATVREESFSHTCDELCEGISALAVPIRDPWGNVFAALGASAPTLRLQRTDQIKLTLNGLRKAAAAIETLWSQDAGGGTRAGE